MKKIIPSLLLLIFSFALLSTSTYAWFTMNQEVTVANMQITAAAEEGISIAAYDGDTLGNYSNEVDATVAQKIGMKPVFTADCDDWYHAASISPSNAVALTDDGYELLDNSYAQNHYLYNKFSIKSSGNPQDIYVKEIRLVSGGTQAYDPSVRVAIKSNDALLFFAPIGSHSATETTQVSGDITSVLTITLIEQNTTDALILSQVGDTGADVEIWFYFDGEDATCKSDNIVTFAASKFDVVFTSIEP